MPNTIAPACCKRSATTAFLAGIWSFHLEEPPVLGIPFTSYASFRVIGKPCNGPQLSPLVKALSASIVFLRASSSSIVTTELMDGLCLDICSSCISNNSWEEISLLLILSIK